MSIKKLNPYINFNGVADQAIALYEQALGAKVEGLMRWGDVPETKVGEAHKERVMHAMLHLGGGIVMLSDGPPNATVAKEGNVDIVLDFDDVEDMTAKFDALAAGGKVTHPLHDTFWGAKFGMLTDQFGVRWMFNCEKKT